VEASPMYLNSSLDLSSELQTCSELSSSNQISLNFKINILAGHQWLTPVILVTQEAEIRKIEV
jgi:hypothetical protein